MTIPDIPTILAVFVANTCLWTGIILSVRNSRRKRAEYEQMLDDLARRDANAFPLHYTSPYVPPYPERRLPPRVPSAIFTVQEVRRMNLSPALSDEQSDFLASLIEMRDAGKITLKANNPMPPPPLVSEPMPYLVAVTDEYAVTEDEEIAEDGKVLPALPISPFTSQPYDPDFY